MKRFVLASPGRVLESVYDLDLSDGAWIRQITRGISDFIDGGVGTLGCVIRFGDRVEMPVLSPVRADEEVPAFEHYLDATEKASGPRGIDVERFGQLFAAAGMGTLSVNRATSPAFQVFEREFAHTGIVDAAGLIVPHEDSRSFLFFTARQTQRSAVPTRAAARWVSLQRHIAAVYGLRRRLDEEAFNETEAVWFETNGSCVEAGPATRSDVRERLRQAVKMRERARSAATSSKRSDLETYWSRVVSGEFAILDRFDSDGRRYVIALPISRYGDALRGLSPRERDVLELLSEGLANKLIAYELGISTTAVSTHLNTIYRKLAIDDRAALVQLVRTLRRSGRWAT